MTKKEVMVASLAALLGLGTLSACTNVDAELKTTDNTYQVTDEVTMLDIQARAGTVAITPGEGPIQVKETRRYIRNQPNATHTVTNGTLQLVDDGCEGGDSCYVDYTVQVPAATAVTVKTNAGVIDISGMAGALNLNTAAGKVTGTDLTSTDVVAASDTGQVQLTFTIPPNNVDARTSAGEVVITVPAGTSYAVDAQTTVGTHQVTVTEDSGSPHKILARATTGRAVVQNP